MTTYGPICLYAVPCQDFKPDPVNGIPSPVGVDWLSAEMITDRPDLSDLPAPFAQLYRNGQLAVMVLSTAASMEHFKRLQRQFMGLPEREPDDSANS